MIQEMLILIFSVARILMKLLPVLLLLTTSSPNYWTLRSFTDRLGKEWNKNEPYLNFLNNY